MLLSTERRQDVNQDPTQTPSHHAPTPATATTQGPHESSSRSPAKDNTLAAGVDEDTRNLVEASEYLKFTTAANSNKMRVVCTLTGQEIIPDYMQILKYVGSRRVQRLLADGGPFNLEVHKPKISWYL